MVWQMCQAYNATPSKLYGVDGASVLFFDIGVFLFGRYVEGELQEAESSAKNEMFARSNRARAFARCMGDDMTTSSAGFADPAVGGLGDDEGPIQRGSRSKRSTIFAGDDEILWVEGGD